MDNRINKNYQRKDFHGYIKTVLGKMSKINKPDRMGKWFNCPPK